MKKNEKPKLDLAFKSDFHSAKTDGNERKRTTKRKNRASLNFAKPSFVYIDTLRFLSGTKLIDIPIVAITGFTKFQAERVEKERERDYTPA